MKYVLLQSDSSSRLTTMVNDHLAQGWKLHGSHAAGFATNPAGDEYHSFTQAMVFPDDAPGIESTLVDWDNAESR